MSPQEQHDGIRTLGDARRWLEQVTIQIEEGELEGQDAIPPLREIAQRLLDVELRLGPALERRTRRRLRPRFSQWSAPRLTSLHHHRPEPLTVPSHYLRTEPPHPAPTIALVTPSFQQGVFLERTIYSVISQHYPKLEYVIQDGGSTDATIEVLRRYEHSLDRWESTSDGGQADAVNSGFAGTSGEIMAFLNSDDLLLPGALAYVGSYFSKHPEVDALYSHRMLIDEHDGRIGAHVLPPHDNRTLGLFDFVPQETLFWRRRAWEAAGGEMDTSFGFALDWDLLLRLRDSGARIVRVPRFLAAFRVHAAQKSRLDRQTFQQDSERLMARSNARGMTLDEAFARAQPYLRRHVLYHTALRARERLPLPRSHVRTVPPVL
jgi:hypothetical protein